MYVDPVVSRRRRVAALLLALLVTGCAERATAPSSDKSDVAPITVSLATGVDTLTGATIISDKDDYAPGEVVHVSGHGWTPGELVQLEMTEDKQAHDVITMDVAADDSGAFSVHFYDVNEHDLGVTFTLTATGAASGAVATMTFTDAAVDGATLSTKTAACDAPKTTFTTTETVCGSAVVSVNGAIGQNLPGRVWLSFLRPNSTVQASTFFSPVTSGQNVTATTVPDIAGTWKLRACRGDSSAPNCQGANFISELEFTVTGVVTPQNTAPVLTAIGAKSVNELTNITFDADASDDGFPAPATLTFSLGTPACANPVPAAATIDATTGVFSWTPTAADAGKEFCARVVVSDGSHGLRGRHNHGN